MSETAIWSLISIAIGIILACVFHFCITDKAKKTLAYILLFVAAVIVIIVLFSLNSCSATGIGTPAASITNAPVQAPISEPTPGKDEGTTTDSGTSSKIVTARPYQGRIAAGYNFTVALRDDGSVVCVGGDDDINVDSWQGIKQIAAYGNHILGLYQNGAVTFTGKSVSGEREVSSWRDIAQVAACYEGSIGLTEDGHVLFTGFDKNKLSECESWSGIERILGGEDHIVALTKTGNIVTSGYNGGGSGDGRRQDFDYNNVVEGFAASGTTFCVFSDKSVEAFGTDWADEDMIGGWTDIVAISGGDKHTVGLKDGGTVVAMGNNEFGQLNVKGWSDIIAIYCGQYHTVGLKSDGTLVATGLNDNGQCNVSGIDLW